MALYFELVIVLFIIILGSFFRPYRRRRQQPPGPLGFPFFIQFPFELIRIIFSKFLPSTSRYDYFKKMNKNYGEMWSVDLGGKQMVVLVSVDLITEALMDNAKLFSGRTIHESFRIISEDRGIVFISGEMAQTNRQLVFRALRDLGIEKKSLEARICQEVDDLINKIDKNLSRPIKSPEIFVKAVSNVISLFTFDERNQYDDPQFEYFIGNIKGIMHSFGAHEILELFENILNKKYLRKIFPVLETFIKSNKECMEFISNKCRSRIQIQDEFSKPNCVFDYFWRYRYQDQPEIDPKEKFLDISHSMFDLFFGGSDTTTNILGYSCLILGKYPDIQKELRSEIQLFVDDHQLINIQIKKDCPKLLSFIDEVQRLSYIVPHIHRRVMKTCIFKGYKLHPNDLVYGDIATIQKDPAVFQNPDHFNLYRFMDESRTNYVPNKSLLPFGIGKRACLGANIASVEIFLFLSKLIQRFNISLSDETKMKYSDVLEGTTGIVHAPLDHSIIFELWQPL